jgi:hypothetical protein
MIKNKMKIEIYNKLDKLNKYFLLKKRIFFNIKNNYDL